MLRLGGLRRKMIVHRFMSAKEYNKLMAGEVLENNRKHEGQKTTSVGFCFFTEQPSDAIHWLSGCVDADYCVTMEVPNGLLTPSLARYRDPQKHNPMSNYISSSMFMVKNEWCCQRYSASMVKVIYATTHFEGYTIMRRALQQIGLIQ